MESIEQFSINLENKGEPRKWPDKETYLRLKTHAILEHKPIVKYMISHDHSFPHLNKKQLDTTSELLADFIFGAEMVFRRFGLVKQDLPLEFRQDGSLMEPYLSVTYDGTKPWYVFHAVGIAQLVKKYGRGCYINHNAGGMQNPKVSDIFELGGVEETAHYIFRGKKGYAGSFGVDSQASDVITVFHTSDIERRALLWKLQYVEKYMPEYAGDFKNLESHVFELRASARKKSDE